MKNYLKFTMLAFLAIFAFSCNNDDDNSVNLPDGQTIAQIVAGNSDYSSLGAALERAGLVEVLNGTDQFTVFAPNNDAFATFLNQNGFASLEDVPVDVLTGILLNHVVSGRAESGDLSTGYINSLATFGDTSANLSLYIDLTAGVVINGISTVTQADIDATNGVIHAIDTVIGIPSVVTQATANPTFSTLVDALVAASGNDLDYVALLSGTTASPFTVFAPTNDAFASLLSTLGFASLDDIPQTVLRAVLDYHVIGGVNVRSLDLTEGGTATTLLTEELTFTLQGGPQVIDATGMPANIIVADVQTGNGVVHAIDKVLIPEVVLDVVDPTIFGLAMMTPSLSSLVQALELTGLDAAVDDRNAQLTVFAPTNEAFDTFLDGTPLDQVPVDALTQILLNHVVGGVSLSGDLSTGYINTLATFGNTDNNLSMFVNTDGGVVLNGVSTVQAADNVAANGVVHIVNAVIDLPTVVTFAAADATFETLVTALTRSDQPDFVSVLSTPNGTAPAPFTVFAPTNQAFADLLTELGLSSLDDIDGPTLTATLNTHVIAGANVRQEDLVSGTVSTLGDDIVIDAGNATITDPNGRVIQIIATNVQAANGVVHVISSVILPQL